MTKLNKEQVNAVNGGVVNGGCIIGPKVPTIPKVFK